LIGQALDLLVRDLTTGRVTLLVQLRPDRLPRLGRRVAYQVHHHLTAHQRTAPRILGDGPDLRVVGHESRRTWGLGSDVDAVRLDRERLIPLGIVEDGQ
jgi:hypothetical protein